MADLTVTITESVVLNNADQGGTHTLTITGVDDVYKRIVTCTNAQETTLAHFATEDHTSDAAIDLENVKYIRVTNLHSSDTVDLSLQISTDEDGASDDSTTILLDAGKSFMMGTIHDGIATDSTGASMVTTLVDLESLIARPPGSNPCQVEVFVASVV
jgi:hypothetical protein